MVERVDRMSRIAQFLVLRHAGATMTKAQFYYFKASGKFYTQGDGLVPPTNETWSREQLLAANGGRMPGLSTTGSSFMVVIIPDETAETGWPQVKASVE